VFYVFYEIIYSCEFPASLLQSSVSHDPSEIILKCRFAAQEKFIINVEITELLKITLLNIFVHFFQDYLMNRNSTLFENVACRHCTCLYSHCWFNL